MELRTLTPADAADFRHLRLGAFRTEPEAFGSTVEEVARRTVDDFAAELGRGADHYAIGAFVEGALAGIVGFDRDPRVKRRHRAKLWGMYVDRAARGRGIGRLLVDELVARASRVDGLEQLFLTVMADNGAAHRLYERAGFAIYGRAPRAMILDGRALDELLMWLDLRGPDR